MQTVYKLQQRSYTVHMVEEMDRPKLNSIGFQNTGAKGEHRANEIPRSENYFDWKI